MMKNIARRWLALILAVLCCIGIPVGSLAETEGVSVSAEMAVLMEAETGRVLYADQTAAMASTTKIMTALLTLEAAAADDTVVTITEEMVAVEGSSLGLRAGDQISLYNLAAGMLTVSGNDAARSAAIFLAGSEEEFAQRMNDRAEQLGMTNTHFVTASGLDAEEHYSTAEDMAKLAAEALKNEDFFHIASSPEYPVSFVSPEKTVRMANHNKLLGMLPGCVGVKTGYTKKAGRCLVSAAEREGVRLVCVTLNAPDDWNDHIALYESAFSSIQAMEIAPEQLPGFIDVVGGYVHRTALVYERTPRVLLFGEDDVTFRVTAPPFLYAPVPTGETVGTLEIYTNGVLTDTIPVRLSGEIVQKKNDKTWWQKLLLLFRIGE